jgi:hypothetical protein
MWPEHIMKFLVSLCCLVENLLCLSNGRVNADLVQESCHYFTFCINVFLIKIYIYFAITYQTELNVTCVILNSVFRR